MQALYAAAGRAAAPMTGGGRFRLSWGANQIRKNFVSLCCKTGYAAFAQTFSGRSDVCNLITAPFHSVHGAIASQYCQTLFAYHLLEGETFRVAFRHARDSIPGGTVFRLWQHG